MSDYRGIPDAFLKAFSIDSRAINEPSDEAENERGEQWVGIVARYYHGETLRRLTTFSASYLGTDLDEAIETIEELGFIPGSDKDAARLAEWQPEWNGPFAGFRKRFSIDCDNPACSDQWHADVYVFFVPVEDARQ